MNTADKCEAVIRRIVELANAGKPVTFEEDWGGNSLTINVGSGHTHVGYDDAPFDLLVDNLYNTLHGGPGLSWAGPGPDDEANPNPGQVVS